MDHLVVACGIQRAMFLSSVLFRRKKDAKETDDLGWVRKGMATVLAIIVLFTVLMRGPSILWEESKQGSLPPQNLDLRRKEHLKMANAQLIERLWLVFGPAVPELIFRDPHSRNELYRKVPPGPQLSSPLEWMEGELSVYKAGAADMVTFLTCPLQKLLLEALPHVCGAGKSDTRCRKANRALQQVALQYAEAIVRVQWVRARYLDYSLREIIDRMTHHAKALALVDNEPFLPPSIAKSAHIASRGFHIVSDLVGYRELWSKRDDLFTTACRLCHAYLSIVNICI